MKNKNVSASMAGEVSLGGELSVNPLGFGAIATSLTATQVGTSTGANITASWVPSETSILSSMHRKNAIWDAGSILTSHYSRWLETKTHTFDLSCFMRTLQNQYRKFILFCEEFAK